MLNRLLLNRRKRKELKTYLYVLKLFQKSIHPAYLKGGEHGELHKINLNVLPPPVLNVGVPQRHKGKKTGKRVIEYKDFQNSVLREACGVYLYNGDTHYSPLEDVQNIGKERILYNGDYAVLAHEFTHYLTYHLTDGGTQLSWGAMGELFAAVTDYTYSIERVGFWAWLKRIFI